MYFGSNIVKCPRCGKMQASRKQCIACEVNLEPRPKVKVSTIVREQIVVKEKLVKKNVYISSVCTHCGFLNDKIPTLKEIQKVLFFAAMKMHNGNSAKAAQEIGVSQSKMWRMIQEYGYKKGQTP